jgi:hypothetical protein
MVDQPERTTVRLPKELLVRAKRKAAAQGRTLTALIEDGLRIVVAEKPKSARPHVPPRISKAGGGMAPGMTLHELEELEDIEYVQRFLK